MVSRTELPINVGENKQKRMDEGRNRRRLRDIGNLGARQGHQVNVSKPVTRNFRDQLLANAQAAAAEKNKQLMNRKKKEKQSIKGKKARENSAGKDAKAFGSILSARSEVVPLFVFCSFMECPFPVIVVCDLTKLVNLRTPKEFGGEH
ncbi:hypothetical protein VNO78_12023 [Psophocarpus tetragonolobus]|uniref:Uncharacterized protein n=1 Tax=Psophocarpus tetragonolobus TaxID=3891 RepID=A0AAN9XP33_PSOTE